LVTPGAAALPELVLAAPEAGVLVLGVFDEQALSARNTTVVSARVLNFTRIIITFFLV